MNLEPKMPDRLVLDASAALAVLRNEPSGVRVLEILRDHTVKNGEVVVPQHFWLEVGNVLLRRYGHTPREVIDRVRVLDDFEPRTVDLDRPLWLLTLDRMQRFKLAAYDALYLAVADVTDASLLTLDSALAAAAGLRAVHIGPHRLAESAPDYEVADPSEVWAQFGGYLAELRREAAAG
jgi:predicted nucleic acid-binding protein